MDPTSLLDKAPELGAILIVVGLFLKALKSRDCTLKDIADRYTEAMKENSRVVGQNTELLRENITLLRSLNGKRGP